MKRVRASLAILAFLVFVSVFSGTAVSRRCTEMLRTADKIEELLGEGDSTSAELLADEMNGSWSCFRRKAPLLISNARLTEIDRISLRMAALIGENSGEALAELAELRELLARLKASEIPLLTSIL